MELKNTKFFAKKVPQNRAQIRFVCQIY